MTTENGNTYSLRSFKFHGGSDECCAIKQLFFELKLKKQHLIPYEATELYYDAVSNTLTWTASPPGSTSRHFEDSPKEMMSYDDIVSMLGGNEPISLPAEPAEKPKITPFKYSGSNSHCQAIMEDFRHIATNGGFFPPKKNGLSEHVTCVYYDEAGTMTFGSEDHLFADDSRPGLSLSEISEMVTGESPEKIKKYVWVDLETDGLEKNSPILEMAIVITRADNLEEIARMTTLIPQNISNIIHDAVLNNPFIFKMHTNNGLFQEHVEEFTKFRKDRPNDSISMVRGETFQRIIDFMEEHLDEGEKPRLAGQSISADRRWLEAQFKEFLKYISHRNIDVSTLTGEMYNCGWTKDQVEARNPEVSHRALDDILDSIKQLRRIRKIMTYPAGMEKGMTEEGAN